ncbi:MAG: 50S ribosomal protein L6 [Candidatus Bipolaricaulota bacterium]
MSKIGKRPIPVPEDVQVELHEGRVLVKGPYGTLEQRYEPQLVSVELRDGALHVSRCGERTVHRSRHGLYRALIANVIHGVKHKWQRDLELRGLGYRARLEGRTLVMELGYSHPVHYEVPDGVEVEVPENTRIRVSGVDKQRVGQAAAVIRGFRPPEPYRGTGVRYRDEEIVRKAGKVGVK